MRGTILGYNPAIREGVIAGSDDRRYDFRLADWSGEAMPVAGHAVDFQPEGDRAAAIYRLGGATGSGDKSRIAAALLAFFLGGLGVHKFYLGRNGAGIIMLLCSLFGIILLFLPTFVIGLIAFIEFIIYLVTSDEDFDRKYVQGKRSWF